MNSSTSMLFVSIIQLAWAYGIEDSNTLDEEPWNRALGKKKERENYDSEWEAHRIAMDDDSSDHKDIRFVNVNTRKKRRHHGHTYQNIKLMCDDPSKCGSNMVSRGFYDGIFSQGKHLSDADQGSECHELSTHQEHLVESESSYSY